LAPERLNGTTNNPRVVPSQSPRDAKERATRADAGGPTVDKSTGRVEQLLSGAGFVRWLAFEGMKLINVEAFPPGCDHFCDPCRCRDIWSRNLPWFPSNLWHNYDLSAEWFEHASTLSTVSCRHGDDQRMTERSTHNRETCTHITTRHFHHWCARFQPPISTRRFDDGARGAVLHAAPWLHELRFSKNSAGSTPDAGQFQCRCPTNEASGARSDTTRIFHRHPVCEDGYSIVITDDYDRKWPSSDIERRGLLYRATQPLCLILCLSTSLGAVGEARRLRYATLWRSGYTAR
jgi:hypothetical protein